VPTRHITESAPLPVAERCSSMTRRSDSGPSHDTTNSRGSMSATNPSHLRSCRLGVSKRAAIQMTGYKNTSGVRALQQS